MTTTNEGIFGVRTGEQLRAFLYVLVPVVILALNVAHAAAWIGLALAILSPALAAYKSTEGKRTILYGLLTAGAVVLLALDVITQLQIDVWWPVITTALGGVVAAPRVATAR